MDDEDTWKLWRLNIIWKKKASEAIKLVGLDDLVLGGMRDWRGSSAIPSPTTSQGRDAIHQRDMPISPA